MSDATEEDWPVKIIRSSQRRKTVSARLEAGTLIIRAPEGLSDADLAPIIDGLRRRLRKRNRSASLSDELLEKRAQELNRKYFGGQLRWRSVRYVTNQNSRFGSCTPEDGTIRLSHRLATMPVWVRDYVLVHELAHLIEGNHGKRFWKLVNRYPLTERARGYLMAVGLEELEGNEVDGATPPVDPGKALEVHRWKLLTSQGEVTIELQPALAPWHVASVVNLTRKGFYDGLPFHRVVADFVVQGGDPTGTGWGGPDYMLPAETGSLLDGGAGFTVGGIGVADAGKDTGGSQWFAMTGRAPHLDGRYTWIGAIVEGQDIVDRLQIGDQVLRARVE